jgi:hypothetical protein
MLHSSSTPRSRAFSWLCVTLPLACLLFVAHAGGCASGSGTSRQKPPNPVNESWDDATVGERLGRLDVRMRTASPDSLPLLQEEYRRLLAERTGQPVTAFTGGPEAPDGGLVVDTLMSVPRRDLDEPLIAQRPPISEPRTAPPYALDEEEPLKGFRASELDPRAAKTSRKSARSARGVTSSTSRPRVAARSSGRVAAPRMAQPRTAAAINERGVRQRLVSGITAARSGNYEHAVRNLAPVIAAGKGGQEARFYYATALERTGDLPSAMREYLKASKAGGSLGDKAYLAHLRVMAAMGERERARELVNGFIRSNPESGQVVQARKMLQTM